jgi:hypothetical protein
MIPAIIRFIKYRFDTFLPPYQFAGSFRLRQKTGVSFGEMSVNSSYTRIDRLVIAIMYNRFCQSAEYRFDHV